MSILLDATGKTILHARFQYPIRELIYPRGFILKLETPSSDILELVPDQDKLAELQATIAQLQAEIEQLKGGQGDLATKLYCNVSNVKITANEDGSHTIDPASQPAPVSADAPWSGEGLPPVGSVCEYLFQPGHRLGEEVGEYIIRDREWVKAEVLLHHVFDGKRFAVIHAPGHGFRGCSDTTGEMFRPIAHLSQ
jgi:hypothetical protein